MSEPLPSIADTLLRDSYWTTALDKAKTQIEIEGVFRQFEHAILAEQKRQLPPSFGVENKIRAMIKDPVIATFRICKFKIDEVKSRVEWLREKVPDLSDSLLLLDEESKLMAKRFVALEGQYVHRKNAGNQK